MKSLPVIDVLAATGIDLLVGAGAGQRAVPALLAAAERVDAGPLNWVALDFTAVEMVSASAAREALFGPFQDAMAERGLLVICAGLNAEALDEVNLAAQALSRPFVVADSITTEAPAGLSVRGSLEPKQLLTLKTVARLGETDAKTAHELSNDGTGVTAWNNRLSSLEAMRLLVARKSGKTKYYSLPVKGLVDGN